MAQDVAVDWEVSQHILISHVAVIAKSVKGPMIRLFPSSSVSSHGSIEATLAPTKGSATHKEAHHNGATGELGGWVHGKTRAPPGPKRAAFGST